MKVSPRRLGALLLGYYDADNRLLYAGRVGAGMPVEMLAVLHERLKPLAILKMALARHVLHTYG